MTRLRVWLRLVFLKARLRDLEHREICLIVACREDAAELRRLARARLENPALALNHETQVVELEDVRARQIDVRAEIARLQ